MSWPSFFLLQKFIASNVFLKKPVPFPHSFGLYVTVTNGGDNWGNGDFPHIKDIWDLFQPTIPYSIPTPEGEDFRKYGITHLSSYHGEFGVSRERILQTPKAAYAKLLKVLTAPKDDPIYKEEGHWSWKGVEDGCVSFFMSSISAHEVFH